MANQETSSVRPLPKRVLTIRNDECDIPLNLYMQKYISADNETNLARDLLIHKMYEPVTIMIARAVFYAYMGFRSIYSFIVFFRSLYGNITSTFGRAALKTWFLEAIQQREYLHYKNNNHLNDKKKHDSLMAMINGILNDRLVDKADCVTYLSSLTLATLNIIPCKARFDRRCERLDLAPMNQQDKGAVSEKYGTLANKVIHHYILATMEMDNTKHGYAIIPLTKIGEYDKLFRSYLGGDDNVGVNVIVDIMLDLFMDEIQHNYSFWVELIKQSKDMEMTCLSTTAVNEAPRSSLVDEETPDRSKNNKSILAELFALKLSDTTTVTTPCAVYYTLALLIKDDLLDLDTLLSHQQQDSRWLTPLIMAMFSIGDDTSALWVLQKTKLVVSGFFCDWLQQMMVARITSWFTEQTATKATTTAKSTPTLKMKRKQKNRLSPLSQVTLPRDGYYFDTDTDDEDVAHGDYDDQHIDHCAISPARTEGSFDSTTTAVNTLPDDNTMYQYSDDGGKFSNNNNNNNEAFDYFSTQFFFHHHRATTTTSSPSAFQLLSDFLVPCMISIGGTQMAASPNTMNNIIVLLHQAIRHYHQPQDRSYLIQLFTSYIFPVLAYASLADLHECLQLLTAAERMGVYLRWRDDCTDKVIRGYRDQAMADVQDLLDSASCENQIMLDSLAQHHPIDVAQVILDRLEKTTTDGSSLLMMMVADLICDQALVLDGLLALLAHRLMTFEQATPTTTENPSSLPPHVASLCRLSRYLFNDRGLPATAFSRYLTTSSSVTPAFFTSRFIRYACGNNPDTLQKQQQQQQQQMPSMTKKRNANALGVSYLTNKKSCQ